MSAALAAQRPLLPLLLSQCLELVISCFQAPRMMTQMLLRLAARGSMHMPFRPLLLRRLHYQLLHLRSSFPLVYTNLHAQASLLR